MLSGGHVQIQFLEYTNKESRRLDGGCCDFKIISCVDDCENSFDICYRTYNLSQHSPCDRRRATSHEFDDSEAFSTGPNALGNGVPNPFMFRFEQEWLVSNNYMFIQFKQEWSVGKMTISLSIQKSCTFCCGTLVP